MGANRDNSQKIYIDAPPANARRGAVLGLRPIGAQENLDGGVDGRGVPLRAVHPPGAGAHLRARGVHADRGRGARAVHGVRRRRRLRRAPVRADAGRPLSPVHAAAARGAPPRAV